MSLNKKDYFEPMLEIEKFTVEDAIQTSSQDSGENPPIIINHGNGNVEMYVESPSEIEEGVEY